MAVQDWSTTAGSNTSIDGININEGCAAGNMNGAVRAVMANVRVMYNGLPDVSTLVTKASATFSGTRPRYSGEGAFFNWADPALASGRGFVQAAGAAPPSMAEGDLLFETVA